MKTQARMITLAVFLTGAMLGHQADAVDAAPPVTFSHAEVNPPSPDPSSTNDLVNSGEATLSSVSSSGNVTYYGGNLNTINDGAYGTAGGMSLNPVEGATVTFVLNTNANPAGYDITQIVSIAGYTDGIRADQNYDVAVHTVDMAPDTFSALVSTGVRGSFTRGGQWSRVSIGGGGYALTSGVDRLRFTFHPCKLTTGGEQPDGSFSDDYREIDVFGVATYVPRSGSRMTPPATNITPTWTYSLSAPSSDPTSSTDLINRAQATLYPSVLFNGNTDFGTSPGVLNDGSFGGDFSVNANQFGPVDGATVTYSLETALRNKRGYDIRKIVSFASSSDGRRTYQKYDVAAHYVGTAAGTFVALSSVNNLGYNTGAPEWTQVSIGDGSSTIAAGVDQLRFTFHNNSTIFPESFYREIDVFGSPVPPAGTIIWLN